MAEKPADLILMDIKLEGPMSGIQTAEHIREEFHVPVIFISAFADDETFIQAKNTGPFGYLVKPFQDRELKIVIEIALLKSEMEGRLQESEEWFRTVFESSRDGILIAGRDLRLVDANMAASTLTLFRQDCWA
jgi:DNA-binding response OmpR family regulator